MKDNETFEFENRTYINPDVSRDEQTAFIDTLRDIQAQNNAQIATETHNLGTDVEPIRGGLTGSEEYWNNRYQTPQTNAAVANMKAVAQQTALNDALSNYQGMLQNRNNQAYRDYQKRAYNHDRSREKAADAALQSTNKVTTGTVDEEYTDEENIDDVLSKQVDAMQENNIRKETMKILEEQNRLETLDPHGGNGYLIVGSSGKYGDPGEYVIQDSKGNLIYKTLPENSWFAVDKETGELTTKLR